MSLQLPGRLCDCHVQLLMHPPAVAAGGVRAIAGAQPPSPHPTQPPAVSGGGPQSW